MAGTGTRSDARGLDAQLALIHECEGCMPWRGEMPIGVVRRPEVRIAEGWVNWTHVE